MGSDIGQRVYVPRDDQVEMPRNGLYGPVPPCQGFQAGHAVRGESLPDGAGRVAANDGVRGNIRNDHRAGRDDGAVANVHSGHDECVISYPDIIANDRISLVGKVARLGHDLFPSMAENLERIGGDAGELVVGTVHDELGAASDGAELADDQLVANEGKVVENIALETLRVIGIVVIGVLPNDDVRISYGVLDEADLWKTFHRVLVVWIGTQQFSLPCLIGISSTGPAMLCAVAAADLLQAIQVQSAAWPSRTQSVRRSRIIASSRPIRHSGKNGWASPS